MSRQRPRQLTRYNASAFELADVIASYDQRTPYPPALASTLVALTDPPNGPVLELGCGPGNITRTLAKHVTRIDAVDISWPMLEVARARCRERNVRWLHGAAEDVELQGPYALALSGDALGWMDWDRVLRRVADNLAEGAHLALVSSGMQPPVWSGGLGTLIARFSVMQEYDPYDFVEEITRRGLFLERGRRVLGPEPFERTVDQYLDGLHASAGLARERMGPLATSEFDDCVRALVAPYASGGTLTLFAQCELVWGTPVS